MRRAALALRPEGQGRLPRQLEEEACKARIPRSRECRPCWHLFRRVYSSASQRLSSSPAGQAPTAKILSRRDTHTHIAYTRGGIAYLIPVSGPVKACIAKTILGLGGLLFSLSCFRHQHLSEPRGSKKKKCFSVPPLARVRSSPVPSSSETGKEKQQERARPCWKQQQWAGCGGGAGDLV
ncbi:hypothetical protein IF2G_09897 [Cordyceps javanica]|nr:hypothetical protein IF2G_09897 [Cordyceps javanica]